MIFIRPSDNNDDDGVAKVAARKAVPICGHLKPDPGKRPQVSDGARRYLPRAE